MLPTEAHSATDEEAPAAVPCRHLRLDADDSDASPAGPLRSRIGSDLDVAEALEALPLVPAAPYRMKRYRFVRTPCLHVWIGEIVVGPWRCAVCTKAVASGAQAVGVRCELPGCTTMHCSACHRRLLALGLEGAEAERAAQEQVEHC